jgi:hypothetical protein
MTAMSQSLATAGAEARPALPGSSLLREFDTPGPRYTSYPTAEIRRDVRRR